MFSIFQNSYTDHLRSLNLWSLHDRLPKADLINPWKIFYNHSIITPPVLFTVSPTLGVTVTKYSSFMHQRNADGDSSLLGALIN